MGARTFPIKRERETGLVWVFGLRHGDLKGRVDPVLVSTVTHELHTHTHNDTVRAEMITI